MISFWILDSSIPETARRKKTRLPSGQKSLMRPPGAVDFQDASLASLGKSGVAARSCSNGLTSVSFGSEGIDYSILSMTDSPSWLQGYPFGYLAGAAGGEGVGLGQGLARLGMHQDLVDSQLALLQHAHAPVSAVADLQPHVEDAVPVDGIGLVEDRKSTRLNSSHLGISY